MEIGVAILVGDSDMKNTALSTAFGLVFAYKLLSLEKPCQNRLKAIAIWSLSSGLNNFR